MSETESLLETDSDMKTHDGEIVHIEKEEIETFKVHKDEGKPRPEKKKFEDLIKEKKI